MPRTALTPKEHDVYTSANGSSTHRRVIGVVSGKVVYSRGGNTTLTCSLKRFRAWVKKTKAFLMHQRAAAHPTNELEHQHGA